MKTINPNCWAPYEWNVPVLITAPPVANINNLYYSFYIYNSIFQAKTIQSNSRQG